MGDHSDDNFEDALGSLSVEEEQALDDAADAAVQPAPEAAPEPAEAADDAPDGSIHDAAHREFEMLAFLFNEEDPNPEIRGTGPNASLAGQVATADSQPWTDPDGLFGKKMVFQRFSNFGVSQDGVLLPQLDRAIDIARRPELAEEMLLMGLDQDSLAKAKNRQSDIKQYDPSSEPLHQHYCCADMSVLWKGLKPSVLKCNNRAPLFWKRTWSGPNTWAIRGHCTAESCPDGNYCIDPQHEGNSQKKWKQTEMLRNDYVVAVQTARAVAEILEVLDSDTPPTVQQCFKGFGRALRVRCGVHFKYAVYTDLHRERCAAEEDAAATKAELQQRDRVLRARARGRGNRGSAGGRGAGGRGTRGRGAAQEWKHS